MHGASDSTNPGYHRHPHIVVWEMTRACVLRCAHCRAEAQRRPAPGELTTDEAHMLIGQVAAAAPQLFILTGGDPFMRPDLEDIIATASHADLRVALAPSATPRLLKADWGALRRTGLRSVSLSLDASTAERHDAFRGVRGTWERTVRAAASLREAGLYLQINTTLSRDNLDDLPAMARLMDGFRPDCWSVFLAVPTGRAAADLLPSPAETETALRRLYEHALGAPYRVKTTEAPQYRRIARLRGDHGATFGLNAGRGFVFVSHTGDIQPSGFLPVTVGNVRRDELIDLYRNHPTFQRLRDPDALKGKCGRCDHRTVCGGSRARAYALTGDMFAEEFLCPYQPKPTATALVS